MKKRAVLFLLVLCAVLTLALPAMAKTFISSDLSAVQKLDKYKAANTAKDTIVLLDPMTGENMATDDWKLNTRMEIGANRLFNPTGMYIDTEGVLAATDGNVPFIDCAIENHGTIESGTYTGTITNYGTITGGTFMGQVKNFGSGKVTGGDFTQATMVGSDDSFAGAYITVHMELAADEHIAGETTSTVTRKILRGSSIGTEKPTRDGDRATTSTVFAYWQKKGLTGTEDIYDHARFLAPDAEITVTPVWCDHVVIFDNNAPAGYRLPLDWMLPMAFYKAEGGKLLPKNLFECYQVVNGTQTEHKKWFLCWNTAANGKGLNYPEYMENGMPYIPDWTSNQTTTTMYARWASSIVTGPTQTIIYRRDAAGSEQVQESAQWQRSSYTLRENMFTPERGKEFVGWKVQNIEKPAILQPGQSIMIVQQEGEADVRTTNITAVWQDLPVTEITFDANGTDVTGTTGNSNKETYFLNETPTLPKNGFVRTDYIFTGWNTKPDGTGTGYTDGQQITIEGEALEGKNVTLYAQWKSNTAPATPTPPPATPLPPTGDNANLTLWMALCIASAAALIVMKNRRFSQR